MANPPVVENLPTDVVSLTEAQSLRHQTLQLPVAEPVARTAFVKVSLHQMNTGNLTMFEISEKNHQNREVLNKKNNPVSVAIWRGHNLGNSIPNGYAAGHTQWACSRLTVDRPKTLSDIFTFCLTLPASFKDDHVFLFFTFTSPSGCPHLRGQH